MDMRGIAKEAGVLGRKSLKLLNQKAMKTLLIVLAITSIVYAQFGVFSDVAHEAVLTNAVEESRLPTHLLNGFYKDPKIRSALARSSWFGPGESRVIFGEADKITRQQIFTVLKYAGLLPQQQTMSMYDDFGFVCIHWSLGGLVLIGLAASEYSGAGTVVALPIAAITVTISALCGIYYKHKSTTKRQLSDIIHFLIIWFHIFELLMAAATCARVASATVDYTSEEKLRVWLFGLESHSLGEPWPDVLGVTIIAVITALFMLGLEKSTLFCILLYFVIGCGYMFFVTVGASQTDIRFWNWTEDFMKRSWGCVLITSALCSHGFVSCYSSINGKGVKLIAFVFVPLICYSLITLIFTLMSHYREIAGSAIPLVRVFEIRDVGWARLIMAMCTICVVCLVLTEIMPPLYDLIMRLARKEWQILVSPILYRSTLTGAPILAIFTAGSLSSILAFACPLSYLVRLLNISTLLKSALISATVLYACFKSNSPPEETLSMQRSNIQYSKLKKEKKTLRSSNSILPRNIWPNNLPKRYKKAKAKKDAKGDKEYLLLDRYGSNSSEIYEVDCESSSGTEAEIPPIHVDGDNEDSSSSTDIDAVVQEYKDRVKVTTSKNFNEQRTPTIITSRVVLAIIMVVFVTSVFLSLSITANNSNICWLTFIILCICLVGLLLMPRYTPDEEASSTFYVTVPYLGLISIILNVILATTLLTDTWPGILFWVVAGFMLFCHCGCCYCEENKEQVTIYRKTESSIIDVPVDDKYGDTVIIPR
ncbi:hypothetical protein Trydic_g15220 [Trypoxylus dichotomus]